MKIKIITGSIVILSVLIPLFVFSCIYFFYKETDIQPHAHAMQYRYIPVNFLYFVFTITASGFSYSFKTLFLTSIIVLIFSTSFKILLSFKFVEIGKSHRLLSTGKILIYGLFFIAISVVNPLGFERFGKLIINPWHNSTTIFVMPFVVLLFYYTIRCLEEPKTRYFIYILILSLLNLFIKPNFLFALYPVFGIFIILKYRFTRPFRNITLIYLFVTIGALFIYIYTYENTNSMEKMFYTGKSQIKIGFLEVWSRISDNLILDFILSITFPLLFFIFYFKKLVSDKIFIYTGSIFIVSFLISVFVYESGPRMYHGNFFWQAVMCNYLLFLISGIKFADVLIEKYKNIRLKLSIKYYIKELKEIYNFYADIIIITSFAAHIFSGAAVVYLYYARKLFE